MNITSDTFLSKSPSNIISNQSRLYKILFNISSNKNSSKALKILRSKESFHEDSSTSFDSEYLETSVEQKITKPSIESIQKKYLKKQTSLSNSNLRSRQQFSLQLSSESSYLSPHSNLRKETLPQLSSNTKKSNQSLKILASKNENTPLNKNNQSCLFFQARSATPFEIKKQPPMKMYGSIAPITTLYNSFNIIKKNQFYNPLSPHLYPRNYIQEKSTKKELDIKFGYQTAQKIIKDIDSDKRYSIEKVKLQQKKAKRTAYILEWKRNNLEI